MKILAPIMNSSDIDILNPNEYNTEFFCGYLPQWWIDEYNDSNGETVNLATPINNRNGKNSNVTSLSELEEIVKKTAECHTDVFLVLNAKYYPEFVYENIRRYIEEVVSVGIKRMIVCDVGMINFLYLNYPQIKISVSCLNQTTNSMSVLFYKSFPNVDRIVFPRHMSSIEIENIAKSAPDLEFEYFIFSNKCLYDDGYCRGIHEFTPICKDLFYNDFYSCNKDELSYENKRILGIEEHIYSDWTRNELNCSSNKYCTPNFACCACSLINLSKLSNITSVKMSIRGHSVDERLRQVKMAHEVIKGIQEGVSLDDVKRIVSAMYGKESLCKDSTACMMI